MNLTHLLNKHVITFSGPTQAVALIRIGLVCLIWARWARDLVPFRYPFRGGEWEQTLVGLPFFVATLCLLIGWRTRMASIVTSLCLIYIYYYLGFVVGIEPYTHHHTYALMIMTCCLALTPCGRSFSLDRWLELKRCAKTHQRPSPEVGALWATRLMALQISLMYLWSAVSKTNLAYLSGDRMEQIFRYLYLGSHVAIDLPLHIVFMSIAIATVGFEYSISIGLWIPRFRNLFLVSGIGFHLILYYLLPVGTFSLTMCLMYLVFIPPQSVENIIARLSNGPAWKKV